MRVSNRDELQVQAEVIPLIEQIGMCALGGSAITSIEPLTHHLSEFPSWVVFGNSAGQGFALNLCRSIPNGTLLRQRINTITFAQKLLRCFAGNDSDFPLFLQVDAVCPEVWQRFRLTIRNESIVCAASLPPPSLLFRGLHRIPEQVRFSIRLQGNLEWRAGVSIGSSEVFKEIAITCSDQNYSGVLGISDEGTMTIRKENSSMGDATQPEPSVLIRLDLGEIQLSVQELLGLRAGMAIELDSEQPLRCYLRIGATTLGVGELSPTEHGLRLKLCELVSCTD